MAYHVIRYRTDGSGYTNNTINVRSPYSIGGGNDPGADRSAAGNIADDYNRGSVALMRSGKSGTERAIPDEIYAAGENVPVLSDDGSLQSPYNGEISHTTAWLLEETAKRIETFGADGVVRFSAYKAYENVKDDAPGAEVSSLRQMFNWVKDTAEINNAYQEALGTKPPAGAPGNKFTPVL